MQLKERTLQKLREIINGDGTAYKKSGPKLVEFFNSLGSNDHYGPGFPARWYYTDEKLRTLNGTPRLDECIKKIFSVEDYIENIEELDQKIAVFNKYLAFDKWQVVRENDTIIFNRLDKVVVSESKKASADMQEDAFLQLTFDVNVNALKLDANISAIIEQRLRETELCVKYGAPLAAVILIGGILEGVLLGTASDIPRLFNQAQSAPKDKDTGKVKIFSEWTLNNMIDVAAEIGILKQDVKKFSHAVREFRNYIHPYQQLSAQFSPDEHTALICFQVLKAAIYQMGEFRKSFDAMQKEVTHNGQDEIGNS